MHFSGLWIINSSIFFTFICDAFVAMVTLLKLCSKVHNATEKLEHKASLPLLQICPRFSLYICVCIQWIILKEDNKVFLKESKIIHFAFDHLRYSWCISRDKYPGFSGRPRMWGQASPPMGEYSREWGSQKKIFVLKLACWSSLTDGSKVDPLCWNKQSGCLRLDNPLDTQALGHKVFKGDGKQL